MKRAERRWGPATGGVLGILHLTFEELLRRVIGLPEYMSIPIAVACAIGVLAVILWKPDVRGSNITDPSSQ